MPLNRRTFEKLINGSLVVGEIYQTNPYRDGLEVALYMAALQRLFPVINASPKEVLNDPVALVRFGQSTEFANAMSRLRSCAGVPYASARATDEEIRTFFEYCVSDEGYDFRQLVEEESLLADDPEGLKWKRGPDGKLVPLPQPNGTGSSENAGPISETT